MREDPIRAISEALGRHDAPPFISMLHSLSVGEDVTLSPGLISIPKAAVSDISALKNTLSTLSKCDRSFEITEEGNRIIIDIIKTKRFDSLSHNLLLVLGILQGMQRYKDEALPPGQGWIISRLQNAGYVGKSRGLCHGVAYSGKDTLLINPDPRKFNSYLNLLDMILPEQIQATLEEAQEKWIKILSTAQAEKKDSTTRLSHKETRQLFKNKLTPITRKVLALASLMQRVVIYQSPAKFNYLFLQKNVSQMNIQLACELLQSLALEKLGGSNLVTVFSGIYNKCELFIYMSLLRDKMEWMAQLQKIRSKAQGHPYSPRLPVMIICSADHTIALRHQAGSSQWVLIDANQLPAKPVEHNNIADIISSAFWCNDNIALHTKVYAVNSLCRKVFGHFQDLFQNEEWKKIHAITETKATIIDARGGSWLRAAVMGNELAIVQQLLENKACPNQARKEDNATPLLVAAENGFSAIVSQLLACDNIKVEEGVVYDIDEFHNDYNTSGMPGIEDFIQAKLEQNSRKANWKRGQVLPYRIKNNLAAL